MTTRSERSRRGSPAPWGDQRRAAFPGALSRRGILLGAAASALAAAGCGGEEGERGERTAGRDAALGAQLLELEFISVDILRPLSTSSALEGDVREIAGSALAHERAHVERLEPIVRRLRGRPPERAVTGFGVEDADQALDVVAEAENLIASAYLGTIERLGDPELREAVLEIQAVEGAHAATFDHLAGRRPRDAGAPAGVPPALRTGAFVTPRTLDFVERRLRVLAVL